MTKENENYTVIMKYGLNIIAKEEGSKYRIPTADEFIETLKIAYKQDDSPIARFVDENQSDLIDQYQKFASYFYKVNGKLINDAIYISERIAFDAVDRKKFSISITHSKLKGLKQVRVSWGNLKS